MVSLYQVSSEKQVKDSDVVRKRVQNEVEDYDVARKRRVVNKVGTKKEIIVIDDEDSDSQSSGSMIQAKKRRPKGVVRSRKDRWGAQIYINQQRIWLGTFTSKEEAALAYDSAAIKIRGSNNVDSLRNIPFTDVTVHELGFQSQFSCGTVLKMIRQGSYFSEFYEYLKEQSLVGQKPRISHNINNGEGGFNFFCKKLFQKELTPSDVGSLNRLVIPKKFAVMYLHGTVHRPGGGGDKSTDSEIVCYDRMNKEWKFRFCYWKSSQSFVLTRGWNAFIKAKNLKAKDTILFFTCHCSSDKTTTTTTTKYGIDVQRYDDEQKNTLEKEDGLLHNNEKENDLSDKDSNGSKKQGGFRLFGVQINI